jgi:hypothetical protein
VVNLLTFGAVCDGSPAERLPKFDDFRDGVLYEYKKEQTNFINKQNEFHGWFEGAKANLDQAERQVKAAKGIPIVWRSESAE